ncbi:MAG: ECF transporter S component [Promethearchaeota archaeon]
MVNEIGESSLSADVERKIPENETRNIILNIAITAILTALETILTASVSIPIPATTGYFNVGEGLIYFTAILFGPYIGAFVGGVGAAFADILGPYAIFAPGTFVAKGLEGFIIGIMFKKINQNKLLNKNWKIFSIIFGLFVGGLMALLSDGSIPIVILGFALMLLIWILGFTVQKNISIKLLSIITGGIVMVLGYFLYESLILNLISPGYYKNPYNAALIEVPFNILQVLTGIFIAISLIAALEPLVKNYYR